MKYFTIEELIKSDTATRLNIDNTPSDEIIKNLETLIAELLDPFREAWGDALRVTSGYRCEKLNSKIAGASKTSAHLIGYAADLVPTISSGKSTKELLKFAKEFLSISSLNWDQALLESNSNSFWLHLGLYNQNLEQRKQIKILNI